MIRSGLYPQLGRYFRTQKGRTRLWECLTGKKEFTEAEKRAIWNAILVKTNKLEVSGNFDAQFKRKAGG